MTRLCPACNAPITAPNGGRGQWSRWCSDACRSKPRMRPSQTHWATCQIEGCSTRVRSARATMCEKHYMRMRRNGTLEIGAYVGGSGPDSPSWRGDKVQYRAAHRRIANSLGPARNHLCVDCGARAHHWSYDHGDPAELLSDKGYRYSLKVEHYQSRCRPCHVAFDHS